ncbi:hypothetical protein D9M70_560220 [compost metagenome]
MLEDHRGSLYAVDVTSLLFAQRCHGQHLQRAEHAIQRGADLVAHSGQESGFRLAGLVGLLLGQCQRALHFGARADIGEGAQHHVLLFVAGRCEGDEQRPAVVGEKGLDGAGRAGSQRLAQQLVGVGRVVQLAARLDAQPLGG